MGSIDNSTAADGVSSTLNWQTGALTVHFLIARNGTIGIHEIVPAGATRFGRRPRDEAVLPLHQVRLLGEGNHDGGKTSRALVSTSMSMRLKYKKHREYKGHGASFFDIETFDNVNEITVLSKLTVYDDVPVLRAETMIRNDSEQSISVTSMPSLVIGGVASSSEEWWHDFTLSTANNSWFREAQWREQSLLDLGIDDNKFWKSSGVAAAAWATYSVSNQGTFSTGTYLPMGMLTRKDLSETWLWQVENNGSWKWEVGDWEGDVYLAAGGPNHNDHHWTQQLNPGGEFTSVPVAVCHIKGGSDAAFQAMTQYRRRIRRSHKDNVELPLIFNDYMNCLMGDPTEDKIRALIQPAVQMGAEYFVIDAGWYADNTDWWNDVGLWEPSKKRFPSGIDKLVKELNAKGLVAGAWIEPESIGISSQVAQMLPEEAFFQQGGKRIIERNRYQLDFRHEAVRDRLGSVIDRLVTQYGFRYFKFDYNIEIIQGTDVNTSSPGAAQLDHNRAYLRWVSSLFDKYPGLVIENCSSGAQRMDYAMLSVHPIQSTSDQEDPVLYSSIAAAVFTAVTPEQSATWAYPQKDWDDETNALTVVNSLLGRIHLSGRLDQMSPKQLSLINEGMKLYKEVLRAKIPHALPFWPLGLPRWRGEWLAVGLLCGDDIYLSVWRRGGPVEHDLPIPALKGIESVQIKLLYPKSFPAEATWQLPNSVARIRLPDHTCARVFHLQVQRYRS